MDFVVTTELFMLILNKYCLFKTGTELKGRFENFV